MHADHVNQKFMEESKGRLQLKILVVFTTKA